jgi:hypothetical protein
MTKTSMIVTGTIIALGIYDLTVVAFGGVDSSVSRFFQNAGFQSPFIAFTVGYICGHFWGFMAQKCKSCGGDCK